MATQSSLYLDGRARRAIDGRGLDRFDQCSSTHTLAEFAPWWRLDLRRSVRVGYVSITNRKDHCYRRINGAHITVGDSLDNNGANNPL